MNSDKLQTLFVLRKKFMNELQEMKPGSYPKWPVDIATKEAQQSLRDTALKGIEEMFEALQHLKNWKPHRDTDLPEFNRAEFLEEVVDSFNYFLSVLVLVGVNEDELFEAYKKKHFTIIDRLRTGY